MSFFRRTKSHYSSIDGSIDSVADNGPSNAPLSLWVRADDSPRKPLERRACPVCGGKFNWDGTNNRHCCVDCVVGAAQGLMGPCAQCGARIRVSDNLFPVGLFCRRCRAPWVPLRSCDASELTEQVEWLLDAADALVLLPDDTPAFRTRRTALVARRAALETELRSRDAETQSRLGALLGRCGAL